MSELNELEWMCVRRYLDLLRRSLGDRLVSVVMFGSAARGDMWPAHSPMHSDIDLLVITRQQIHEHEEGALLNQTYPLYLECGRQVSPHFHSEDWLSSPPDEQADRFLRAVSEDARALWPLKA